MFPVVCGEFIFPPTTFFVSPAEIARKMLLRLLLLRLGNCLFCNLSLRCDKCNLGTVKVHF